MTESLIDLRSDTVTKPTPAMRQAMFEAEVGDDVYGEDPTVNLLEQKAAAVFQKQAALFVPTGSMGNAIAIKCHTTHGQEVICDSRGHLLNYELSMTAWVSGCLIRAIPTSDGLLSWAAIEKEIRPLGPHAAQTGCIEVENTHNMAGGTVYSQPAIDEICDRAHERGIPVHMDGARVFNAAAAAGRPVDEICARVDTVMSCLSKGLGAPVGSLLMGSQALIDRGRLLRKRLGGGMRQVGVLAAAGLIALEQMPQRLSDDHDNARLLADGLAAIEGITVAPSRPATNIVIFDVAGTGRSGADISRALKARGVLMNPIGPTAMRAVTHYDVTRQNCVDALAAMDEVCAHSRVLP